MLKFIRLLILVLAFVTIYALPASAQTGTKAVKFYIYLDGNNNGVLDYIGYDYCIGGNTLTAYKLGTGLQPWLNISTSHADVQITTYAGVADCKNNSSGTYQLAVGNWQLVGGSPSHTNYFTVPTNVTTLIQPHRMTSWSGE